MVVDKTVYNVFQPLLSWFIFFFEPKNSGCIENDFKIEIYN